MVEHVVVNLGPVCALATDFPHAECGVAVDNAQGDVFILKAQVAKEDASAEDGEGETAEKEVGVLGQDEGTHDDSQSQTGEASREENEDGRAEGHEDDAEGEFEKEAKTETIGVQCDFASQGVAHGGEYGDKHD